MSADDRMPAQGPSGSPQVDNAHPADLPRVSTVVIEALRRVASEIGGARTDPELLAGLVAAILSPDRTATDRAIAALRSAGVPADGIIDAYLPAAARALGQGWCDDSLPSAAVTFASARLHGALRRVEPDQPLLPVSAPSILVVLRAGETHTLGTSIAAAQFRRAGASVSVAMGQSDIDIALTLRQRRFDLVALSVPAGSSLASVRSFVDTLRHAAPDPIKIALGGSGLVGLGLAEIRALGGDLHANRPVEVLAECGLTAAPAPGRPASGPPR